MKNSNRLALDWVKINLLALDPSVATIAGWQAQEIFMLAQPMRHRLSTETHEQYIDYFCDTLSTHMMMREHNIDHSENFEIFRKTFKIN